MKKIVAIAIICLLCIPCAYAEYGGEVEVEELAKTSYSWDGAALPAYPEDSPEVTVLRIKIPPGTTLPLHYHPLINVGYLISGALTVIKDDGTTLYLDAGDAIIELVDSWHYGKNEGDEIADIVVFYMGTPGAEITVKHQAAQ